MIRGVSWSPQADLLSRWDGRLGSHAAQGSCSHAACMICRATTATRTVVMLRLATTTLLVEAVVQRLGRVYRLLVDTS
jgi:hypothetical protein